MDFVLAHYLQSLPEEKRGTLSSFYEGNIPSIEGTEQLPALLDMLHQMHSSWLTPIIQNFSHGDQRLFLSILTQKQQECLRHELQIEGDLHEPSSLLKTFLCQTLAKAVLEDAPSLSPLLPSSPLNQLLHLSFEKLHQICFFLGLHDLASEVKKIIQSDKLKRIETILSTEEKKKLKELVKTKELVTFGSLNLQNWDNTESSLREVLFGRGMNRLAKALYGESPTLIWYLSCKLEKSQADMLQKLCVDPKNVMAQEVLKKQVVATIKENL